MAVYYKQKGKETWPASFISKGSAVAIGSVVFLAVFGRSEFAKIFLDKETAGIGEGCRGRKTEKWEPDGNDKSGGFLIASNRTSAGKGRFGSLQNSSERGGRKVSSANITDVGIGNNDASFNPIGNFSFSRSNETNGHKISRDGEPVMIGAPLREAGSRSAAFPVRRFEAGGHVCKNMWFEDCFWKVSKIISSHFRRATRDFSFYVERGTAIARQEADNDAGRALQDWEVGPVPSKLGEGKVHLEIVKGLYYAGERPKNGREYDPVASVVNVSSYRLGGLALQPKNCALDFMSYRSNVNDHEPRETKVPWIAQFSNVWVSGTGVVLVPKRPKALGTWYAHAYEIGGGCCPGHWRPLLGKAFAVDTRAKVEPLLFSIGQHHGVTFHHVMKEMLPRVLSFWSLLSGLRTSKIVLSVDKSHNRNATVGENMLEALGWPRERTVSFDQYEFRPVKRLFVPAPFSQDQDHYSNCYGKHSARLFRELVDVPQEDATEQREKPRILLIDRASSRPMGSKSSCRGLRCIANLLEIKEALEKEFGDRVFVKVTQNATGGRNVLVETIRQFKKARIVIGGHGAGFQNLMFMKKGGYAIHIGWNKMWKLYASQAKQYGIHFQNVITPGAGQSARNITADVGKIVHLVGSILKNKEFQPETSRLQRSV